MNVFTVLPMILFYRPELVKLGTGDDGAVFMTPCGYDEAISTDTMVEGIHFTKERCLPLIRDIICVL